MSTVAPMGSSAQCAAQAVLGPLRGGFTPYLALSTAANRFCASSGFMSVFQYLVITSPTLPNTSGAISMLSPGVGRAGSLSATTPACAQMSMPLASTSGRIGIDPFFMLKATWVAGEVMTLAINCCAAMASLLLFFGSTKTSPLIMYGAEGPQPAKQPNSLPAVLPAARNSPLAQSPTVWNPALSVTSHAVVSFQLRPATPGSV